MKTKSVTDIASQKMAVLRMNRDIFYAGESIQHPDMVLFNYQQRQLLLLATEVLKSEYF